MLIHLLQFLMLLFFRLVMASPSQEQLQGACPNPVRAPETPTPEDPQATDHTPDPRAHTSRATSNFTKKRHFVAGTLVASKAM